MSQRVGTCSICGGDVMGVRGAWYSVNLPPPDKCNGCGAVAQTDVIQMHPAWNRRALVGGQEALATVIEAELHEWATFARRSEPIDFPALASRIASALASRGGAPTKDAQT